MLLNRTRSSVWFPVIIAILVLSLIIIGIILWRRRSRTSEQSRHTSTGSPVIYYALSRGGGDIKNLTPIVVQIRDAVTKELGLSSDTLKLQLANEARDVTITQPSLLLYIHFCPTPRLDLGEKRFREFLELTKKMELRINLIILRPGQPPLLQRVDIPGVKTHLKKTYNSVDITYPYFDDDVLQFGFLHDNILPYKDPADFNHNDMMALVQKVRETATP